MDFKFINNIFSADFNIFNIVSLKYEWSSSAKAVYVHRPRKSNGLLLLGKGSATYRTISGEEYPFDAEDIVLLPKNAYYTIDFRCDDCDKIKPYMVNFDISDTFGNEISLGKRIVKLGVDDGTHATLFKEILELYKENNFIRLKSKTYELLSKLFPLHDSDELSLNYIKSNISSNLSIPHLAERSNLCETSYRKKFKKLTGESPVKYITRLKLEKACHMLTYSDTKPDDISVFLNFSSPSYFYRVFKEYTNTTPREYKKLSIAENKKQNDK